MPIQELYKFDSNSFLTDGLKVYAIRTKIESVADQLASMEFKNIIFTGVGGTTAELYCIQKLFEKYSDYPTYLLNAAEALATEDRRITSQSLIVTASKSGDTPETVDVCKYAQSLGAKVFSFVGDESCPLANNSDYFVVSPEEGMENTYLRLYLFALRLLHKLGCFKDYDRFADQMKRLHPELLKIKYAFAESAEETARKYWNEPYQLWIGSDMVYGDLTLLTMCILEEMQWMKNRLISSAEFFHGPLELVDNDLMVTLVKSIGPCRKLDERVERFLRGRTNKLVIIDLADLVPKGIDEDFHYLLSPVLLSNVMAGRYCWELEKFSHHDLSLRRYYRQFNY